MVDVLPVSFSSWKIGISFVYAQVPLLIEAKKSVGINRWIILLGLLGCNIFCVYISVCWEVHPLKKLRVFPGSLRRLHLKIIEYATPRRLAVKLIEYAKYAPTLFRSLWGSSMNRETQEEAKVGSVYVETGFVVVIAYVLLLQVNWIYISLAVFPVIAIWFVYALSNELNRDEAVTSACCGSDLGVGKKEMKKDDKGEASAGSGSDLGGGKGMDKREELDRDEGGASACSGGDLGGGKDTNTAKGQLACVLAIYLVFCSMPSIRQFHIADNFTVSIFLFFLSFMLVALTRMMMQLALTGEAPGGAPAAALLRKVSLVVLLLAVHTVAFELLGEEVVLLILLELGPLLIWLSVHVDSAKPGPVIIRDDRIIWSTNLFGAVAVVFLACRAFSMGESFSWKAVVHYCVSGLLVWDLAFTISQWQGQDAKATPFLEETVKLLKVWARALLIIAFTLLVPTVMAAGAARYT